MNFVLSIATSSPGAPFGNNPHHAPLPPPLTRLLLASITILRTRPINILIPLLCPVVASPRPRIHSGALRITAKMLRLRRYRVFVALTVVFLFLLYRVQVNAAWDDGDVTYEYTYDSAANQVQDTSDRKPAQAERDQKPIVDNAPTDHDTLYQQDKVKIPDLKPVADTEHANYALPTPTLTDDPPTAQLHTENPVLTPLPVAEIPDRRPGQVEDAYVNKNEAPAPPHHIEKPPGRFEASVTFTPPIHWTKLPENFPIDEASMISLPTGKPKSIPTIQYSFGSEDAGVKEKRESRMEEIKYEMKRAWDGYRTYAFGHDELVPHDRTFKDPFCGWAATLVDAMDTLWIMGLKDEFNEAYDGLKDIDFTTTPRPEIPVFETTIRYLGGLIAAYDVTGGHKGEYPLLLKKAVELAEILMGVFDTPNRMPILYYNWKPAFVAQPKRANTRAGIAEFGTLSMEFTRLAQLTGQEKYYDAVARITDALDEWQNREDETASLIPGIFPENIDASGCNRTAVSHNSVNDASSRAQEQANFHSMGTPQRKPEGYLPKKVGSDSAGVELRGNSDAKTTPETGPVKREMGHQQYDTSGDNLPIPGKVNSQPLAADGRPADWDCVPQNLTASSGGIQSYSMGGSQDSAYEYFPKQYLLLGGLEAKYRSLHEKTVAAVKKWLLYRPMVKDTPDVLFSAKLKVSTSDVNFINPRDRYTKEYEVTHLTCFLGGMFAMGGKIFESNEDLEIGRRLTDGCVWAYSSMPAGIMAEYAQVAACQDIDYCEWNETAWHEFLDPNPKSREQQMRNYELNIIIWEETKQKKLRDEAERLQAEEEYGQKFPRPGDIKAMPKTDSYAAGAGGDNLKETDSTQEGGSRQNHAVQYQKRQTDTESSVLVYDPSSLDQEAVERRYRQLEAILDGSPAYTTTQVAPPPGSFGGTAGQMPIDDTNASDLARALKINSKPRKPDTHDEYVANQIANNHLPEGYTAIGSGVYTLR